MVNVKKYRKKPVEIEALIWTGSNNYEILKFMPNNCFEFETNDYGSELYILTLEGRMKANIGDYIIKGVNGEFYPCKPDIFKKTYDEV